MSTLRVEEKITLAAPVERTWRFLLDPADVAACLPGASLDSVEDERNFTGTMKVKVGPVTTEFKGKATFTQVLPEEHKVELVASGNDKGGAGSAKMTMHSRIVATRPLKLWTYEVASDVPTATHHEALAWIEELKKNPVPTFKRPPYPKYN